MAWTAGRTAVWTNDIVEEKETSTFVNAYFCGHISLFKTKKKERDLKKEREEGRKEKKEGRKKGRKEVSPIRRRGRRGEVARCSADCR